MREVWTVKYRAFGNTGWLLSAMGLGTWNIGNQWGELSDAESFDIVRTAVDSGINLIDTAESYGIPHGLSESRLGQALSGIRHKVTLVSKIGHFGMRTGQMVPKTTPDMIRLCAYACLGRMRTDWVDLMLCHENDIEIPDVYIEGFEQLVREGVIRAYGISTDRLDVLRRFNQNGRCAAVELDYSLINRQAEADMLPYCLENGIGVLVRGPLAQGLLSGRYNAATHFADPVRAPFNEGGARRDEYLRKIAQVEEMAAAHPGASLTDASLRYVASHETCPVALPGATNPRQVRQNAACGENLFTPAERAAW